MGIVEDYEHALTADGPRPRNWLWWGAVAGLLVVAVAALVLR